MIAEENNGGESKSTNGINDSVLDDVNTLKQRTFRSFQTRKSVKILPKKDIVWVFT